MASWQGSTKIIPSPGFAGLIGPDDRFGGLVHQIVLDHHQHGPLGDKPMTLAQLGDGLFVAVFGTFEKLQVDNALAASQGVPGGNGSQPGSASACLVLFIMFMRTMAITSFISPPLPFLPSAVSLMPELMV
jgi:hypothetical protein